MVCPFARSGFAGGSTAKAHVATRTEHREKRAEFQRALFIASPSFELGNCEKLLFYRSLNTASQRPLRNVAPACLFSVRQGFSKALRPSWICRRRAGAKSLSRAVPIQASPV